MPSRLLIPLVALCLTAAGFTQSTVATETGSARAERLLAAMGGREAWTKVNFVHVVATHDDLAAPPGVSFSPP